MTNIAITLTFLVLTLLAAPVMAQDAGLYDPVAPEGSAFVRFINEGTKDGILKPAINGKIYKGVDHDSISAYFPLKAGKLDVALGSVKAMDTAESGAFYTAVLKGDVITILKDVSLSNATKSMIVFYNLSGKVISLRTEDGKIEVIAPVENGKSGSREINAVPVTLSAFEGDKSVANIGAISLKRNESTAIVLTTRTDGALVSKMAQATTDTKQ